MQFLVTGCSTGLGLDLARAVLAAGHKVIASSRNPAKTPYAVAEIEGLGGAWITLDVKSGEGVGAAIMAAEKQYGPIDVLMNNAGYAAGGVLETFEIEKIQEQFETNFFGVIRTIQAIVPGMRERKRGVIVNISSGTFWRVIPVTGVYAASKYALEAISEALTGELASFGIRVLLVEPGEIRTEFLNPDVAQAQPLPEHYKGTPAEYIMNAFVGMHGTQALDPRKTADAIVREVLEPLADPPSLRMPLGKDSLGGMRARGAEFQKTADAFESVAVGANF